MQVVSKNKVVLGFSALGIIALTVVGNVLPSVAQQVEYASQQRGRAAVGHYSRARTMCVETLEEFEAGRKYARPDLLLDAEEWRLTMISLCEQLNRLIDPKMKIDRGGIQVSASPRLIRREKDQLPRLADGPKDRNDYGDKDHLAKKQSERARLSNSQAELGTVREPDGQEAEVKPKSKAQTKAVEKTSMPQTAKEEQEIAEQPVAEEPEQQEAPEQQAAQKQPEEVQEEVIEQDIQSPENTAKQAVSQSLESQPLEEKNPVVEQEDTVEATEPAEQVTESTSAPEAQTSEVITQEEVTQEEQNPVVEQKVEASDEKSMTSDQATETGATEAVENEPVASAEGGAEGSPDSNAAATDDEKLAKAIEESIAKRFQRLEAGSSATEEVKEEVVEE